MQLLDIISKSVPDMLWLTDLEQKGNDVTIQGQSTTLIALSDFVGNLGNCAAAAEADRDRQQHGGNGAADGAGRPAAPAST